MLAAFEFTGPDRIPVVYTPSPAGLYVHGQKLLDLFAQYPPDNPLNVESLPAPPPDAIDRDGRYYEVRTDPWGTEAEHMIFGVWGIPRRYPIASWAEGANYRFPPPAAFPAQNMLDKARLTRLREDYLIFTGWVSIFERLHAFRPLDEVLVDLYTGEPHLLAFLDRLVEYWHGVIAALMDAGADVIVFGDDWGTQTATIVSPALFRDAFVPRYRELMAPVKAAGRRVFFHTCGFLGGIFDELLDLGIDGMWPQIGLFDSDSRYAEMCRERKIAIYVHPDRQRLIPFGTPQEIDAAIRAYAEKYRRMNGGGIFHVEMENDAPWENVEALVRAIDCYR
jgi:uroporphyrinogen decarboxylase